MSLVICEPCVGCVDTACVDVCPVDCIHGPLSLEEVRAIPPAERPRRLAAIQLFIDPAECIDCFACAAECPAEAIYHEDEVPAAFHEDIARNARFFAERAEL